MTAPPLCRCMGRQCQRLLVTLRVAELEGGVGSADDEATWLLGHTERIRFGTLRRRGRFLYAKAEIAVACRHLDRGHNGTARCNAWGYRAALPPLPGHGARLRQLGDGRFEYVDRGRLRQGALPLAPPRRRPLPIQQSANPCATARCRTADNRIGSACCRDLQVEIMCHPRNERLEALIRHRRSPFLCKVEREEDDSLTVEMISACSFLAADGVACSLHDRRRPDGRRAKPSLCYAWPGGEKTLHPGCVLAPPG